MKTALYAGSFDPITNGHMDILKTAAGMFDKLIVAIAYNSEKRGFLPLETRLDLIKQAVKDLSNVEVLSYSGLTVEYAKNNGVDVLIRGLRTSADFEYEYQIAQTNSVMSDGIKTVFLVSNPENSYISSSMVREIISHKGDVSKFVPACVNDYLK